MKGVDKEDRDHETDQQGVFVEQNVRDAVFQKERDQEQRSDQFHQQMVPMDHSSTLFALSFEYKVAEDGDIEIEGDAITATGAT